jgi:hypothetical protein
VLVVDELVGAKFKVEELVEEEIIFGFGVDTSCLD